MNWKNFLEDEMIQMYIGLTILIILIILKA